MADSPAAKSWSNSRPKGEKLKSSSSSLFLLADFLVHLFAIVDVVKKIIWIETDVMQLQSWKALIVN